MNKKKLINTYRKHVHMYNGIALLYTLGHNPCGDTLKSVKDTELGKSTVEFLTNSELLRKLQGKNPNIIL